jgi:POT family proton-dependent oligopeptide transporter
VGNLYRAGDARIDRAYSIFYVGINVGATLSPLICGTLGEKMCTAWLWSQNICGSLGQSQGWHFGFFAAGVGVTLGLLVYLYALGSLPPDRIARAKAGGVASSPLTHNDWKAIWAIVALCVPTALFWMAYQQQGNTIALWAKDHTNRTLIPGVIDWQIPATWFQSFNPLLIFLFTPLVIALWTRQSKARREPTVVAKMAIGCLLLSASYLVMAAAAYVTGPTAMASWLWLLLFFVVFTTGELYLSPIGLSLVARVAPPQILSMMMGFWFITSFVGNSFSGYIGGYFNVLSKPGFFLLTAAIAAVASVVMWLLERPLRPVLESKGAPLVIEPTEAPAEVN